MAKYAKVKTSKTKMFYIGEIFKGLGYSRRKRIHSIKVFSSHAA